MKADWKTWSPFQSPEVREICAHMTDEEKSEALRRGGLYGFWVFATLAGPLSFASVYHHAVMIALAAVLVIVHIVCIPAWQRTQKNFLCSTAWAREHDVTPQRLRLFSFRV